MSILCIEHCYSKTYARWLQCKMLPIMLKQEYHGIMFVGNIAIKNLYADQ